MLKRKKLKELFCLTTTNTPNARLLNVGPDHLRISTPPFATRSARHFMSSCVFVPESSRHSVLPHSLQVRGDMCNVCVA